MAGILIVGLPMVVTRQISLLPNTIRAYGFVSSFMNIRRLWNSNFNVRAMINVVP